MPCPLYIRSTITSDDIDVLYVPNTDIVSLQGLLVLIQSEKSVHFVDGRIEHFLDSINVSGYYGYCSPE